jgi:hypothetical protein
MSHALKGGLSQTGGEMFDVVEAEDRVSNKGTRLVLLSHVPAEGKEYIPGRVFVLRVGGEEDDEQLIAPLREVDPIV